MIAYWIYRVAEWILARLPLGLAYRMGRLLGLFAYYAAAPYRALVLRNMRTAFGGEMNDHRALAREHFATLGANLLSSMHLSTKGPEALERRGDFADLRALYALAGKGRGIVVVIPHAGNWEMLSQLVSQSPPGVRVGTVYQALGNPRLDEHVRKLRGRFGIVPFDRRRGFSGAIKLLREGGMVAVLVDQHAGDNGVWAPFFGRLASTSPLAATFAARTDALLVPVAIHSTAPARWKLQMWPPIENAGTTPEELTVAINRAVETQIRVSPRDWFWVHNRWKTPRPEFLLAHYKRGVQLPPGSAPEDLQPFRILIRSTNWLGDAVMSAPAVRAIRAGRPDVRITVAAPAKLADFWRTMPEVAEVIPLERGEGVFAAARRIGPEFDVAFVFPNSVRAALEVFLAGIPRRIGFRRPWRGKLINQIVPEPKKTGLARHQVHQYLAMAKHAGAEISKEYLAPPRPSPAGKWLGLCPGAEYGPAKRWLPERFAEAAERIHAATGLRWRLFGVEKDREIGEAIAARLGEAACENLIGRTTLAELIERLRECRVLLTNDTGTMHLAAHLGVPVVAIFGSTEPDLTGPLGKRSRVLRHHVVCSPCFQRECPLDTDKMRCMEAVTAEEAAAAVLQELARSAA